MSNNHNNGNDLIAMVFVVCAVVIGAVTYGLMSTFDVPFRIGIRSALPVLAWSVGLIAIAYFYFRFEESILMLISPFYISMIVPCLSPILGYIAGERENFPFRQDIAWYGTTWGMFLIVLGINLIGYGLLYWWRNRDTYRYY
ncbi:hypothetical protein ID855_11200 [Xenorhabdus sp. ZM]|uniref:hypothetical protein n=1 Tax=Xenorhabdus szentirmaii TaxID=290112 RepID=UPI0019A97E43|nr:hypothetical protein [Xenorhabdus sp. ZM]MBD2805247.1 hypothetical protein [Xenorhabdus sp. ZM]